MWNDPHDTYLQNRILSAEPVELVRILYQTAADAVGEARRQLAAGNILARARAISKAAEAVLELTRSLDFARGGEIAERLGYLYQYMVRRLTEANFQQADAPLAEVLRLLVTLSEGWEGVRPEPAAPPAAENGWARAAVQDNGGSSIPAHAWSF